MQQSSQQLHSFRHMTLPIDTAEGIIALLLTCCRRHSGEDGVEEDDSKKGKRHRSDKDRSSDKRDDDDRFVAVPLHAHPVLASCKFCCCQARNVVWAPATLFALSGANVLKSWVYPTSFSCPFLYLHSPSKLREPHLGACMVSYNA